MKRFALVALAIASGWLIESRADSIGGTAVGIQKAGVFQGAAPTLNAGTGMSVVVAAGVATFSATGSFSAAPPYFTDGTNFFVAGTGLKATKPSGTPSWINGVTPTNTAAGANGDFTFSGTQNVWATTTATTSVEAEFSAASNNTNASSGAPIVGVWVYDTTNSLIYFFGIVATNGASEFQFQSWVYAGVGNPVFSSTLTTMFSVLQGNVTHLKLSKSGGTLTVAVSLDGGATFSTLTTHSIGTIAQAGYGLNSNSEFGIGNVFSLVVI